MDKKKLEYRQYTIDNYDSENGIIEGYAAIFDSPSVDLGFTEIIDRNAITQSTIEESDVFAVIDHDRQKGILARSRHGKGSLNLEIDDKGLKYSFKLPTTEIGNQLRSHLERGEITNSSFAFTVVKDDWQNTDGKYVRIVRTIDKIYDVSPVFMAAYADTEVALRSFEAFQASEKAKVDKQLELRKKITKMKHKLLIT
jgi:HK97 family phage prohead protease